MPVALGTQSHKMLKYQADCDARSTEVNSVAKKTFAKAEQQSFQKKWPNVKSEFMRHTDTHIREMWPGIFEGDCWCCVSSAYYTLCR